MRKWQKYGIIAVIILVIMFIFNLCGLADIVNNTFYPDEEEKDDDTEQEEEEEEPDPFCTAYYTLTVKPNGDKQYDALGVTPLARIYHEQRLQFGWIYYAVWSDDVHQVSWISDEYVSRIDLLNELRTHYLSNEMNTNQWNWFECMLTQKLV